MNYIVDKFEVSMLGNIASNARIRQVSVDKAFDFAFDQ